MTKFRPAGDWAHAAGCPGANECARPFLRDSGSFAPLSRFPRTSACMGVAALVKVEVGCARGSLSSEGRDMRTVIVAVLVLMLATGCTSLHTVHREPANPFAAIRVGDVVNVHTLDGRQDQFEVAQISAVEIVGTNGQKYQASEITRLQRRKVSGVKTAAAVVGILFAALLVAAMLAPPELPHVW